MVVTLAKRMMRTLGSRKNQQRQEWALQLYSRNGCMMGSLASLGLGNVGPMFKTIELLSFSNRKAWSTNQEVSQTNTRAISHMVNNTFTCPKKLQAHRAMDPINQPSGDVFDTMGLEFVKRKGLLTLKLQRASITREMHQARGNNQIIFPHNRDVGKGGFQKHSDRPGETGPRPGISDVRHPVVERKICTVLKLGVETTPFKVVAHSVGPRTDKTS